MRASPLCPPPTGDPATFTDPDAFDVTRDSRRYLAFGWGPLRCLGRNPARLEPRIVLGTLFRRVPTPRPAMPRGETLRPAMPRDETLRPATPRDELRHVDRSAFSVSALPVTW
ncbi:cytochrome P450 [Streptomyces sp. NPDC003077]|uniref:cytochrome P450 n=1 Tax=Streptomyces sp. NPDC003077 TaxID=3154443 RepID=UPI0033B99879